ncbi:MAG: hypothetical protein IT322_11895 [Anaerolineae bacterium]|nr:hypothetical protein [Anaerolineae bacterium]
MLENERARQALDLDIQHTRWMVLRQERHKSEIPPQTQEILLLPAPPPVLLLGAGEKALEPSSHPSLQKSGVVFSATHMVQPAQAAELTQEETPFTQRLTRLWCRIERLIIKKWYDQFDTYELDNLVQAGIVHLWQAYSRAPEIFDEGGDAYWYQTAKCGAHHEVIREYRQRYRQQGSGTYHERRNVEVVVSAGDLLAARSVLDDTDELDESVLSSDTIYHHDTEEIQGTDRRLDVPRLEAMIYSGTHPSDHPMITSVLGYMREGLTKREMAKRAGVKVATIRCTIRRMQQACGAAQEAKVNRKRPGNSLDEKIRAYREQGLSGTEIARLIGTDFMHVYRRLHALQML